MPPRTSHTEVEAELLAQALVPGARVLDAGCGRRTRLDRYRDRIAFLAGVDLDAGACESNTALDAAVVADLCRPLPFPAGSFDLVYANFVVEHLDDPAAAFAHWRRVLRTGGSLILLTSNRANPLVWTGALIPAAVRRTLKRAGAGAAAEDVIPTRYRANTPRRLEALLTHAGFRPVRVEHVATLHRYAERAPRLATIVRAAERLLPATLQATIVGWYRAA